jgi:hypothetical protein
VGHKDSNLDPPISWSWVWCLTDEFQARAASSGKRIYSGVPPPRSFVAAPMNVPVSSEAGEGGPNLFVLARDLSHDWDSLSQ